MGDLQTALDTHAFLLKVKRFRTYLNFLRKSSRKDNALANLLELNGIESMAAAAAACKTISQFFLHIPTLGLHNSLSFHLVV